jgi:ribonuclease HI
MSSRKLHHYFNVHTIKVLTNQPLNDIFGNRDSFDRVSKWETKLSEYVVDFEKRSAIKSQVLADFIAEWTEPGLSTDGIIPNTPWLVYYDGAWGNAGVGASAILISPSGIKLRYTTRLQFHSEADKCTNNIKEYEAILLGLHKLRAIRVQTCTLRTYSKVVAGQIKKNASPEIPPSTYIWPLSEEWRTISKALPLSTLREPKTLKLLNWPRLQPATHLYQLMYFFQVISDASIKIVEVEPRVINLIQGEDWRVPIMAYLRHYYEPDNTTKHTRM